MNVCLLYRDTDRERPADGTYADEENILRDLGLATLFRAAGRKLIREDGAVKRVDREDPWITAAMRRVMTVPLTTAEEIVYRQEILRECLRREDLLRALYRIGCETVEVWNWLGRGTVKKTQQQNPATKLAEEIKVLRLLCDSLTEIRDLFTADDPETGKPVCDGLESEGLRGFYERLRTAFSPEREETVRRILTDIAFYSGEETEDREGKAAAAWALKPRIVLECGLEDGLKFSSLKLSEVASEPMRFFRPGTTLKKMQEFRYARIPDSFPVEKDPRLAEQAKQLEYGIVRHLTEKLTAWMMEEFRSFFDQLKLQTAFYIGAVQLLDYMDFLQIVHCYPEPADRETMTFRDLRELAMGVERHVTVVGNTCAINGKDLLIVTGANQGGKSTFLRSIGIAQVMMQCGLPVAARAYRSGIFPRIFTHFTRREDSAMNSGRLDEELGRMDRIVDRIGDGSLVLLNESFATTTEKEASVIAYGITKALMEAGVRVLMVTHLLSFARRVYAEEKDDPDSRVEFLSAERKTDGTRTYRMIRHVPEMTSFGLDLYEEIVEKRGKG